MSSVLDFVNIDLLLKEAFNQKQSLNLRELYNEKVRELNLNDHQVHKLLEIDKNSLNPILDGTSKHPNLISVLKIADFLEIDLRTIIPAILAQQPPENIARLESVKRATFLSKKFDLEKLYKEKFLADKNSSSDVVNRVLAFFGFDDIVEFELYENKLNGVFFSQTKRSYRDKMRDFAVKSAYRLFELIDNPNQYNRENLKLLVPKMRPYCQDVENGLFTVCNALYQHGISVVFQKHLTSAQFRGATFFIKDKPCIVITDLGKDYTTLWFALMHELYHVLFDEDQIISHNYHLSSDEPDLFLLNETGANEFAREFFIGLNEYNYIKPHIHNDRFVASFAKRSQVHPSFVYATYRFFKKELEGENYYGAFKKHFPDYIQAVKRLNVISWSSGQTLPDIAQSLKEIFKLNIEKNGR